MSFKLLDKPRTVRVTRKLANDFANMDTVPNDRPLSERRLIVYRKDFDEGNFRPVTWSTCYCKETSTTYRVNGKHTSILLSSIPTIPEFYVTIENYIADTLKEVVELYNTFDSRVQARTARDINRSFAAVEPDLRDLPLNLINVVISGINYAELQEKMWSLQPVERAEKILDNVDFTLWIYNELYADNTVNFKPLMKAGVVAAIYLTYKKNIEDATRFWQSVRDETGRSPDLPDRKLAKYLSKTRVSNSVYARNTAKDAASTHEFMIKSIQAWNAYRKGVVVELRYQSNSQLPKVN